MTPALPLFLMLLLPVAGGAVLALRGHAQSGPEWNVAFSAATFAAAVWLTTEVVIQDFFGLR